MNGDEHKPPFELNAERRAIGRQHTTQLLKMLRGGYGTTPEPITELKPSGVADAAPGYVRLVETPAPPDIPPPKVISRPSALAIPTVGEGLRQHSGKLGQLVAQADQLAESRRVFRAYLRPDLRDHAVLIRLDQEVWTVQTESPVWATRLRYALYDIRQVLGLHFGITLPKPHIQITPTATPPLPTPPHRTLTQEAARCLEETARNETDPRLSAALRRLAQRAESSSPDHVPHLSK